MVIICFKRWNFTIYILTFTVIEDNVWICTNVNISPGVKIGEGAVIGMGVTVNRNVPPLAIVVNASQKIVKYRNKEHYYRLKNEQK